MTSYDDTNRTNRGSFVSPVFLPIRRGLAVLSLAFLGIMASSCSMPGIEAAGENQAPPATKPAPEHGDHDDHDGHDHGDDKNEDHGPDDGHDEYDGHDDHAEDGKVRLSKTRLETLDIALTPVHRGSVKSTLSVPAEIKLDPDGEAHLVPRVAGIARDIFVSIGDQVKQGDLLAVLDSRELGGAKSDYLASLASLELARTTYAREKGLWEERICSEQDFLEAKRAFQMAEIAVQSSQQALFALGLSPDYVSQLPSEKRTALNRYEIRAPFDGTVIARHIARGEAVSGDDSIFLLAELDTMWAMGRVTERDIRRIAIGQEAVVQLEGFPGEEFTGIVDYIGNVLDPKSRTVDARVILDNKQQRIRAGMFGRLVVFMDHHDHDETFLVPNEALQPSGTGAIVYKAEGDGVFEPVKVEVLHSSETMTEVQGPLEDEDRVAVGDVFVLKSEAGKESMGGGHSH